ncbi:MAG: tripartite tricarboxylate transporter TctB family protein [Alphaproteobacteria bacterium]|nr:tripartite tricarboxylate transporter TctB family protein [Alphaproteobacteria bacterium]
MALDKWIAAFFMVGCLVYSYAAFTYRLLPFERNLPFLPNTLPIALGVIGVILSFLILISPKPKPDADGVVLGSIDFAKFKEYKLGQALALIAAMTLYALALRPVGFVGATVLFLVGTGWILGERKLHIMIPAALLGAGLVWYLVQVALGIYLRPLPAFLT